MLTYNIRLNLFRVLKDRTQYCVVYESGDMCDALTMMVMQLFQERLSNKTVGDNATWCYGWWGILFLDCGIEGNSKNKCICVFAFLFFSFFFLFFLLFTRINYIAGKHREPQSINAKLVPPIILIRIVAYATANAFTILWDRLCRNSCIQPDTFIKALPNTSTRLWVNTF